LELITELLRHIFGMGWKIAWGLAALIPRSWWETVFLSPT